jgi:hypothetical protein
MKKLTIRLSGDLHDRLAARAQADQRSINKQVIWMIEQMTGGEKSQDTAQGEQNKTKGSAE